MFTLIRGQLQTDSDQTPAYFTASKLNDRELRDAATEEHKRRQADRVRQADARRSNFGLRHDIAAGRINITAGLRTIACYLIATHYREVIADGAGWTDPECHQPIGDTGRYEPILAAELQRAVSATRDRATHDSLGTRLPH